MNKHLIITYWTVDSLMGDSCRTGNEYPHIDLMEAYKEFLRLGRPLTDSEFEKFIVSEENLVPA